MSSNPDALRADLEASTARLTEKRLALAKSDAAINALTDLIVAAANGEAVAENGTRLSVGEVVKGADAIRQVHAMLSGEVEALEKRANSDRSTLDYLASPTGKRIAAIAARAGLPD